MSKKIGAQFSKIHRKKRGIHLPLWGGTPWYTMVPWYHGGVLQEKVNILAPELFVLNFSFFWSRFDSKKVTQKQGFAYIKIRTGFFSEKTPLRGMLAAKPLACKNPTYLARHSQEKTNILAPELLTMHFACFLSPFGPPCLHLQ